MPIPFTVITLDRPYQVRLGLGTTVAFEKMSGKKFIEVAKEMKSGELSMMTIAELTRAMIVRDRPGITLDEVCDLVDEHTGDITVIINDVIKAVSAAYEDEESPNAQTPTTTKKKRNFFDLRKSTK